MRLSLIVSCSRLLHLRVMGNRRPDALDAHAQLAGDQLLEGAGVAAAGDHVVQVLQVLAQEVGQAPEGGAVHAGVEKHEGLDLAAGRDVQQGKYRADQT